jgi:hypothetical protein
LDVSAFATCCANPFKTLSRAAAKAAASRWRQMGMAPVHPNWARRAAVCETCPLRVAHRAVSYCGRPFLDQIQRDPQIDGCGCPTIAKAKSPDEHCPLNSSHRPATLTVGGRCTCKWCAG